MSETIINKSIDTVLELINKRDQVLFYLAQSIPIKHLTEEEYEILKSNTYNSADDVETCAFLSYNEKTIYYRDSFLNDFSLEEQGFILAHELLHAIIHANDNKHIKERYLNSNRWLLNFVEDAYINQILIKAGFIPPKGVVLIAIENPENCNILDLYEKLEPYAKEIQYEYYNNTWTDNITIDELILKIKESKFTTGSHKT